MHFGGGKHVGALGAALAIVAVAAPAAQGAPKLSIADAAGKEQARELTFQVSLSKKAKRAVKARVGTVAGSAAAGTDFQPASDRVKIPRGKRRATIDVALLDDQLEEQSETFEVRLAKPRRAKIADGTGVGTIEDDDKTPKPDDPGLGPPPSISIADPAPAQEGADAVFTITLSHAFGAPVSVDYATADGSAGGDDYDAESGIVTFGPQEVSEQVTIAVAQDSVDEPAEDFAVGLSNPRSATIADGQATATIADDDPQPAVSILDAVAVEGDAPGATMAFTVSLSNPSSSQISVDYALADGNAVNGLDYTPSSGTLTFTPLQVTREIQVSILPDRTAEPNETFEVQLSNPVNATIGDGAATGTIADDDPAVLNETNSTGEADFCNVQHPAAANATAGQATPLIYGRLFENGVTDPIGPAAGVISQLGIGPSGSDPRTALGWAFVPAVFHGDGGVSEEYQATLTAPQAPGTYAYAFRFSLDGGASVTYCDLNGAGSNAGLVFETGQLGTLTVAP